MKFSAIKKNRILKKTERLLKNNNSSLQVSKNIQTVGIIIDNNVNFTFETLKKLQKKIGSSSNNFSVVTCKETLNNVNEIRGVVFTQDDFSWNGKIKSPEIITFLETSFDMLIDYTSASNLYKKYLVATSKAQFKVGFENEDSRLYDFMIAVNNNVDLFNLELIKYLKILNKL